MYQQQLVVQSVANPGEIYRALLATATSGRYQRMLVFVAYATRVACQHITESFRARVPGWRRMRKEWLVSIDFGLTEPAALEFLANLPNSDVRVADAQSVLAVRLRPATRFHNKLYFFENEEPAIAIFSGSANLTISGLYVNHEQGVTSILSPPFTRSERGQLDQINQQKVILDACFATGAPLTPNLLEQYRMLWRPQRIVEDANAFVARINERPADLALDKVVAMSAASNFWVEVRYVVENRGPGRAGNQIDLQRGSRAFFGFSPREVRRNTVIGTVPIRFGGEVVDCHLRFGNNYMDKLNLPIPGAPGPRSYEDTVLLFARNRDQTFSLVLGTRVQIEEWKRRSSQQGTLYRMQSGREYGVFS